MKKKRKWCWWWKGVSLSIRKWWLLVKQSPNFYSHLPPWCLRGSGCFETVAENQSIIEWHSTNCSSNKSTQLLIERWHKLTCSPEATIVYTLGIFQSKSNRHKLNKGMKWTGSILSKNSVSHHKYIIHSQILFVSHIIRSQNSSLTQILHEVEVLGSICDDLADLSPEGYN